MDGGARAAQSVEMNATNAVHGSERNLQMIIDTIAELACQPAPTNSPSSAATAPTEQGLTLESKATSGLAVDAPVNRSLKDASVNRLACLFRYWTWANEAMAQFERELANGWEYDEDPLADHPFGAYYHWCALLCGLTEAALEHGLLSRSQLDALRPNLEASLPGLRACRRLLMVIPTSLEEHPRIVDLLRDDQTLGRIRRIHQAFGEALREEQLSRELDLLLYEH
jgi:hypothetical protein